MRRLPRILLNAATAASLVVLLASTALWPCSYRRQMIVTYVRWPSG